MSDTIVVNKVDSTNDIDKSKSYSNIKKYKNIIALSVLVVVIIIGVLYSKDGFTNASPDGVVARKSQNQVKSDSHIDKTWNLEQLERSVALLNRKA